MKKGIIALLICGMLTAPVFATDYTSPETIKQVQEALNAAGYDCGAPDGIAGSGTKGQIEKYRADKGLSAGNEIDEDLYSSLLYSYDFKPTATDEEIASIPDIEILAEVVAVQIQDLNMGRCEFIGIGNLSTSGQMTFVDAKYITASGKPVIFSNTYYPFQTPYVWSVDSVSNMDNNHYYYLSEIYAGDYDIYDYASEEIIEHAAEIHIPTKEDVAEENKKKEEIEETARNIAYSELKDTDIESIEINTAEDGSFIVLPHLKWNVKNSISLTNTMLERYSITFSKLLSDQYQEISEVVCFWNVPYISENQSAKFQYFRQNGTMYVGDIAIGWGEG